MSLNSDSDERAESLGVRRPVELPEADIEAAEDLAPASDSASAQENDQATSPGEDAAAIDAQPTEEISKTDESGKAEDRPAQTASANDEPNVPPAWEAAVAASPHPGGEGDGTPPDRPKKTVLAAVAIGGAVLLAIPILLIGTGTHHGKKQRTVAADRILPADGQPPAGAFVSASPTPTPTPTPSPTPKKSKPPTKAAAANKAAAGAAKAGFTGAVNVLVKNAASGMCADVPGYGAGKVDGPVNQYQCALGASDNQVWSLGVMQGLKGPGGAPLFEIRNITDSLCMDLPYYAGQKAGSKVTEYYCRPTKSDNQLWYRTHTSGGLYRYHNYASHGLCLGVTGRSHSADQQLEIHKCGSGDDWSLPSGE
jgi:hypothetical protein